MTDGLIAKDSDFVKEGDWQQFKSTAVRYMRRIRGPAVVVTQEGEYELPDGWDGWIALDSAGFPYPITAEEQAKSYEAMPEWSPELSGAGTGEPLPDAPEGWYGPGAVPLEVDRADG